MSGHGTKKSIGCCSSWICLLSDPVSSQGKGSSAKEGEISRCLSVSDPALVFLEPRAIEALMGTVLYIPVAPFEFEQCVGTEPGAT